jgi:hypothetical protein
VQFRHPCSAHVPHDCVTRFLSASRARNTRTPALLAVRSCCSANALTAVPRTSICSRASAYSGFSVVAYREMQAQISCSMSSVGASCSSISRANASSALADAPCLLNRSMAAFRNVR